jgi:hypothetical protein
MNLKFYIDSDLLLHDPIGWQDEVVKILRTEQRGVFRETSQALQFVRDGAYILREAFYTYGINADVSFRIVRQNKQTLIWETIFIGKFDFTTFIDNLHNVECTAIDAGLNAILKANQNIKHEIDMPIDNLLSFYLETWTANFSLSAVQDPATTINNAEGTFKLSFNSQKRKDRTELSERYSTVSQVSQQSAFHAHLNALEDGKLKIKLNINGKLGIGINTPVDPMQDNSFVATVLYINELGGEGYIIEQFTGTYITQGVDVEFDVSINKEIEFNTTQGNGYCLSVFVTSAYSAYDTFIFQNYNDIYAGVNIWSLGFLDVEKYCIDAKQLFSELVQKISPAAPVKSDILDTLCAFESLSVPLFLTGSGLRRINRKIKISFSEFVKILNKLYGLGCGVENVSGVDTIVIEPVEYFYDTSLIYDIGEISDLTIKPFQFYSKIKAGFKDQTTDIIDSNFEVNSEQEWQMPFDMNIENDNDITVPVRAGMYDVLRAVLNATETEETSFGDSYYTKIESSQDDSLDNEIFIVDAYFWNDNVGQNYILTKLGEGKYTAITGYELPDSAFNVFFSPKRTMLRHSGDIASMLFGNSGNVSLTAAKKYTAVTSQLTTEASAVVEDDPISVSEFGSAIFIPLFVDVTIAQPTEMLTIITQSKEKGLFKFEWKGNYFYGFLNEISIEAAKRGQIVCNLALANVPGNDITKLIR